MSSHSNCIVAVSATILFLSGCKDQQGGPVLELAYHGIAPQVINLDIPPNKDGMGGLIAADVDDDGRLDFLVTGPGYVGAYSQTGEKLWMRDVKVQVTQASESHGLPGWHGPGVQATDVDGDGKTEVLFLTLDGAFQVLNGSTGVLKHSVELQVPEGAERWEHLVVANFRGLGDRDLLLQATNATDYRMGRYLAAFAIETLMREGTPKPLWVRDDFVANAHNGVRVADLDGDGTDEVLGPMIVGHTGDVLFQVPLRGHMDSLFVADVRPDIPGLEVVGLEEGGHQRLFPGKNFLSKLGNIIFLHLRGGGNRVFLYNHERLIWATHYRLREPQNAVVGDFDTTRPGLEVWCRSRDEIHQRPFVFDAQGRLISQYEMDTVAPKGWTEKGVEVIFPTHWTGDQKQLATAKERHTAGDVAIFDPLTGEFLHRFRAQADRLYVVDVAGDWREEIVILNGTEIHIYNNHEASGNAHRSRLWADSDYRRSKMTWNYYSPG
ncbi:MAG: hypothetical protein HKN43_06010 [Rhodothermales bacterium]|nr:hypothetical protein [Rhodothermales bacterium]